MEKDTYTRFVIPSVILLVAVISIIILGGLASENPDGFEWALFDFAGVTEPESGFPGLFSFLGEGPLVDVLTGAVGIVIVLFIGLLIFKATSRKE
jgi:hypothetical protein